MSNVLKGGLADGKTVEDIARKHSVFVGTIKLALEKGIKVEFEHSKDKKVAREIAMDHLWEDFEYYEKLKKMEKGKKQETKESTGADASGSVETPIFSKTILKKDIHNFKPKTLTEMDGIPNMQYDAPIGHKAKDPLKLDNPKTVEKQSIAVKKKGFPLFGGPGATFVKPKEKCKTFPYCDQGDRDNLDFYKQNGGINEVIKEASKKYGISVKEIRKLVSEALPVGMLDDPGNARAMRSWGKEDVKIIHHIRTKDPIDVKTDDEIELAKLKMFFYKHDIPFHVTELKK